MNESIRLSMHSDPELKRSRRCPPAARAIVIGGGPAGCAAATTLAQGGWGVTIVEARPFPRAKVCGEFVSPAANAELAALLPAEELGSLGARRVTSLTLELGQRSRTWAMPTPAWTLSRATLDDALLHAARRAGVMVRSPASVRRVRYEDQRIIAELAEGGEIESEVVVHADGLGALDPAGPTPSRRGVVGHKAHLRLPFALRGLHMRAAAGAYVGMVEVEDGLATCALVARAGLIGEHGGDADAMLQSLWPEYRREWRSAAGDKGPWLSSRVAGSGYVRPGHARSFRVGNAAGAVEPVGGEGIGLAMWSGVLIGRRLGEWAAAGADAVALKHVQDAIARAYRRRLRGRRLACGLAAWVLERPTLVGALWPMLAAPGLTIRPWYAATGKPMSA